MKKLIDTKGTMTAISKLLAEKKKALSEYYAWEEDNSLFDLPEEEAKSFLEEKAKIKNEVKTLDYYLIDIEEMQMAYQAKMAQLRTMELKDWCLMQALKKKHNDELMESVLQMKEVLYAAMIFAGVSDYCAKSSIIAYLNVFTQKNYIY